MPTGIRLKCHTALPERPYQDISSGHTNWVDYRASKYVSITALSGLLVYFNGSFAALYSKLIASRYRFGILRERYIADTYSQKC